ncbi:MAG: hypothetical protein Q8R57_13170 [Bacteroidota bacterium]|nr:hypothetical protein [Bacteroidota bacterium]
MQLTGTDFLWLINHTSEIDNSSILKTTSFVFCTLIIILAEPKFDGAYRNE